MCALLVAASATITGCTAAQSAPRQRSTATRSARRRSTALPAAGHSDAVAGGSRLVTRWIPGRLSHFRARRAVIYLPPAAQRRPAPRLPVLLLLHGTPGSPTDWVRKGGAVATLDRFAARHGGRAPIVIMPDINGATHADSECVDSGRGNVETYLTVDVRRYMTTHFHVVAGRRGWAVAGLSEGGTCSLMLALRHASAFATIGDLSGLSRPTVGPHDDPPATVSELFHGSRGAYDRHDPLWLMRRHRYATLAAWFECGRTDAQVVRSQQAVTRAARRAGMTTEQRIVPGGHSWSVWRVALPAMLPWLWSRMTG